MADMRVSLCGIELDNPVIPASGTFGYGKEFAELYDIPGEALGSFGYEQQARLGESVLRLTFDKDYRCTQAFLTAAQNGV